MVVGDYFGILFLTKFIRLWADLLSVSLYLQVMLRRHRLIWIAVGLSHLVLMAGLVVSDYTNFGQHSRHPENFVTVSLVNEINPESVLKNPPVTLGSGANLPSTEAASVENKISLPVAGGLTPSLPHEPSTYSPPVFLVRENPHYPTEALSEGRQGKVVVKILISAQGKVESTQVVESSGSLILDQAAERAAQSSQFNPAERDHQPITAEALATYRFELR